MAVETKVLLYNQGSMFRVYRRNSRQLFRNSTIKHKRLNMLLINLTSNKIILTNCFTKSLGVQGNKASVFLGLRKG